MRSLRALGMGSSALGGLTAESGFLGMRSAWTACSQALLSRTWALRTVVPERPSLRSFASHALTWAAFSSERRILPRPLETFLA